MNLHNDHNVYILGAGFSRNAGLPLINDFLVRMRDGHAWLKDQGRREEATAIERVLNFRLDAASAAYWVKLDLENIEELFSLASSKAGSLTDSIRLAIAATLDFTQKNQSTPPIRVSTSSPLPATITHFTVPTTRPDEHRVDLYTHHVARMLGLFSKEAREVGKNTFISFNYDTLLEDALTRTGLNFHYGFPDRAVKYHADAPACRERTGIPVLKLHGSTNWGRRRGEKRRSFTVYGNYESLRSENAVPELIPPTWKKVFQNQLGQVWTEALNSLETATRVVIIGFSIPPTDLHFKYLLSAGLQNNISLRQIIFVDPKIDTIEPRAKEILRPDYFDGSRVRFIQMGAREFFTNGSTMTDIGRTASYSYSFS